MEPFSFVVPHRGACLHGTFFICSMEAELFSTEPFSFVVRRSGLTVSRHYRPVTLLQKSAIFG